METKSQSKPAMDKPSIERRKKAIELVEASLASGVKPPEEEVAVWKTNEKDERTSILSVFLTQKDIQKKQIELSKLKQRI